MQCFKEQNWFIIVEEGLPYILFMVKKTAPEVSLYTRSRPELTRTRPEVDPKETRTRPEGDPMEN